MQGMLKTTEVTLPTDTEVRVARSFVAPPERLRHTQHFDTGDLGGSMGDGPAVITLTFEEG